VVIKELGLLAFSALQYQEALLLQVDYLDAEYAEDPISCGRRVILLLEPDDLKPHGGCPAHFYQLLSHLALHVEEILRG
jgi:hypothetical protein